MKGVLTQEARSLLTFGLQIIEEQEHLELMMARANELGLHRTSDTIHDAHVRLEEAESDVATVLGNKLISDHRPAEDQ